ncbi:MAG: AzlC family ABC transporter permease [Chloroflexaceae bacterium]|nr:AzlC family ABC transporter permease [Chloroflexaceae bacterium]
MSTLTTSSVVSPRSALLAGAKVAAPTLLSIFPFGMITGVAAVSVGFSEALSVGMTVLIFAGASQLATIQLVTTGATIAAILLTATMINLRFMLYSASLSPHFSTLPLYWKLLLGYSITDPAFGMTIADLNERIPQQLKHWYFIGASGIIWVAWVVGTILGTILGRGVPPEWSLDFAIPLNFLAVLVPSIRDRATVTSALVGALVAIAAVRLPFNLGLITGALSGIAMGMLMETLLKRKERSHAE